LISVKNGLGADADSSFSLSTGVIGSVNEGKFQLQYEDSGIVFLQGSNITDVYTFVIRVTTAEGDTSDLTIGGQTEGEGALKNLQPSFGVIADKVKTISNKVLIPASDWASAVNGTALTGDNAKEQLIYTFTGSDIPDNWVMDPNSGELTQATPVEAGIATEFTGNPLGIFNITVRLSDANAINSANAANGYTSLYAEQDVQIRLEPAAVNSGALSTVCVYDPPANLAVISPDGVLGGTNFNQLVSCVYYIAANTLTLGGDLITPGGTIPNPDTGIDINVVAERIGTDAHRSGTICFSVNTLSPWNGNSDNTFNMPGTTFYYRQTGETEWRVLPRSLEANRAGVTNPAIAVDAIQSPLRDEPQPFDAASSDGGSNYKIVDNGTNDVWVQTVRSFNYNDFELTSELVGGQEGIEYAILVNRVRQYTPNIGLLKPNGLTRSWVVVDDLEYPTCVPWQGKNAVTENGGAGNLFEYQRSIDSSNSLGWKSTSPASPIFARSPYGDYVNEFYTGATNFTPYIPTSGSPYINFLMKLNLTVSTLDQWTTFNEADPSVSTTPIDLQWVAGFNTNSKKIIPTDLTKVGAVQVSSNPTPAFNKGKGTLRISKN
jgi:hypothetical protein